MFFGIIKFPLEIGWIQPSIKVSLLQMWQKFLMFRCLLVCVLLCGPKRHGVRDWCQIQRLWLGGVVMPCPRYITHAANAQTTFLSVKIRAYPSIPRACACVFVCVCIICQPQVECILSSTVPFFAFFWTCLSFLKQLIFSSLYHHGRDSVSQNNFKHFPRKKNQTTTSQLQTHFWGFMLVAKTKCQAGHFFSSQWRGSKQRLCHVAALPITIWSTNKITEELPNATVPLVHLRALCLFWLNLLLVAEACFTYK